MSIKVPAGFLERCILGGILIAMLPCFPSCAGEVRIQPEEILQRINLGYPSVLGYMRVRADHLDFLSGQSEASSPSGLLEGGELFGMPNPSLGLMSPTLRLEFGATAVVSRQWAMACCSNFLPSLRPLRCDRYSEADD